MKKYLLLLFLPFTLLGNPINTELGTPTGSISVDVIERFEFTSGFK
jgi:hypothetical protein